jgi:hypothetical protein
MAASEATPNNPKNPDTTAVKILIGICNPNEPPSTLKKNKNNIPIPNLTVPVAKKRSGLKDVPTNSNRTITATMMEMTILGSTFINSFYLSLISRYDWEQEKRTHEAIQIF